MVGAGQRAVGPLDLLLVCLSWAPRGAAKKSRGAVIQSGPRRHHHRRGAQLGARRCRTRAAPRAGRCLGGVWRPASWMLGHPWTLCLALSLTPRSARLGISQPVQDPPAPDPGLPRTPWHDRLRLRRAVFEGRGPGCPAPGAHLHHPGSLVGPLLGGLRGAARLRWSSQIRQRAAQLVCRAGRPPSRNPAIVAVSSLPPHPSSADPGRRLRRVCPGSRTATPQVGGEVGVDDIVIRWVGLRGGPGPSRRGTGRTGGPPRRGRGRPAAAPRPATGAGRSAPPP